MALAPPPATAQPAELEHAPLLLPWDLRLAPEQFERVCQVSCVALMKREPQPPSSSNWRDGSKGRKSRSKVTRTWRRASTAAAIQPSLMAFPTS